MATAKPRITVTLEPEAYAVLKRLSQLSGDSLSSLVSSLADLAAPTLSRAADLIEAAKGADARALAAFVESLGDAEARLAPLVATATGLHGEMADLFAGMQSELEHAQNSPPEASQVPATGTEHWGLGGAPEPAGQGSDPRACNHGGQFGTDGEHQGGGS